MKQIRIFILFGTLAVFLYFVNSGIITAENNINNGTVAYFELAPVDPQSILQGFYMELRYDVENDARDVVNDSGRDRGQLVLSLDDNNVAHFHQTASCTKVYICQTSHTIVTSTCFRWITCRRLTT